MPVAVERHTIERTLSMNRCDTCGNTHAPCNAVRPNEHDQRHPLKTPPVVIGFSKTPRSCYPQVVDCALSATWRHIDETHWASVQDCVGPSDAYGGHQRATDPQRQHGTHPSETAEEDARRPHTPRCSMASPLEPACVSGVHCRHDRLGRCVRDLSRPHDALHPVRTYPPR